VRRALRPETVRAHFSARGTVSRWWNPESGPLRFHYEAEIRVLEERLCLPAGAEILDLGTGRGRFGLRMASHGHSVVAVDLNPEMLQEARARAEALGLTERFSVVEAAAENLSTLADRAFDAVLCMELFDHLPHLPPVLAEVRRVLRPRGRFAFTWVPNESAYGALGNLQRWWLRRRGREDAILSRTYSASEIRQAVEGAGFRIEGLFGVGLLCFNAQTRVRLPRVLDSTLRAVARAEAAWRPYHARPSVARRCAHAVGIAVVDGERART